MRRRTDVQCNHIIDLPVGLLVHVATYLAKPSRALFAVAMTASSDWKTTLHYFMQEELSDNSKAILSSLEWDVLDFEDIEKSLAVRLTDDDLHAVLKCIDAHDVLKKLKLTGCINITGCSLEPLRSSTVIELIDLSLAKQFESPRVSVVESKISQEVVIPILDSIVSANGSSLKYLLLPHCWNGSISSTFYRRYINNLQNRGCCSYCNEQLTDYNCQLVISNCQDCVCYVCLKIVCNDCNDNVSAMYHMKMCYTCQKDYCVDCGAVEECAQCDPREFVCKVCKVGTCRNCKTRFCESCFSSSSGCGGEVCKDCLQQS